VLDRQAGKANSAGRFDMFDMGGRPHSITSAVGVVPAL